jgi:predicted DsbA family dithiol-disulfide isomerase
MSNPGGLDRPSLSRYAQSLGLDVAIFDKCLDLSKYAAKIKQEVSDGETAGVVGTPTFFLGLTDSKSQTIRTATRLDGLVSYDRLKQAIDRLLAQPEQPNTEPKTTRR